MKSTITKKLILGSLIFISSFSYGTNNSSQKDSVSSKECLEVVGVAVGIKNEYIDGVEIKLFKENEALEWIEITSVSYHDHNFKFILEKDQYYTIEVSKPGYVTRSIAISTKLPSNVRLKPIFRYEFEVELFKEQIGVDDYYFDFPVALVSYNDKSQVFENNKAYTKHIKTNIKAESDRIVVQKMMNGK